MSRERPILFSGPMVRAILEGRKTQTRHAVRHVNEDSMAEFDELVEYPDGTLRAIFINGDGESGSVISPYGKHGDRLWVRETHTFANDKGDCIIYEADGAKHYVHDNAELLRVEGMYRKRNAVQMPRWASRILLEVAKVKVERLQDITEQDAEFKEGIEDDPYNPCRFMSYIPNRGAVECPISSYSTLWESINGHGSWDANPYVWVVEFKRIQP